jgi:flagellar protein FlaG
MINIPIDRLGSPAPVPAPKGQAPTTTGQVAPEAKPEFQPLLVENDQVDVFAAANTPLPAAPQPREAVEAPETPDRQEETLQRIRDIVSDIQGRVTSVRFDVAQENGEVIVRIVNKESGDMVRQIPSDEILQLRSNLHDLKGMLFEDVS